MKINFRYVLSLFNQPVDRPNSETITEKKNTTKNGILTPPSGKSQQNHKMKTDTFCKKPHILMDTNILYSVAISLDYPIV